MTPDEITLLISGIAIGFYLALLVHVGGQLLDAGRSRRRIADARKQADA